MGRYKIERHIIMEDDVEFIELNSIGLCARNLRNVVVWHIRQHLFHVIGKNYTCDVFDDCPYKFLFYRQIYDYLLSIEQPDFRRLPANVAQNIINRVCCEFKAYQKLLAMRRAGEYAGYVGLPNYTKEGVPFNAIYMRATLSKKNLADGIVILPKTNIRVKTLHADTLRQVNVSYHTGMYFLDVVYEVTSEIPEKVQSGISLGIDCGVGNFATIVANTPAFRPIILDGKEIKSINRYYNKRISKYTEEMAQSNPDFSSDKHMRKLWAKRHNVLSDLMHLYSKRTIQIAQSVNADKIVIGHSNGWKDKLNIGKVNNQNFAYVPFSTYINMLKYKAEEVGIEVFVQEESYTSKASFFDDDFIATYGDEDSVKKFKASGRRVKRGLYKMKNGTCINADVNGALNILRKYLHVSSKDILSVECMGSVIAPRRVRISELRDKGKLLKHLNKHIQI